MKKVLIVFNHPAPYKVHLFNELAKSLDLTVIFERSQNRNRSNGFYLNDEFNFKLAKVHGLCVGDENFISSGVKNHIKNNKYDLIVMNGYSQFAEMKAIRYMQKHNIPYVLFINGGIIKTSECSWKKNIKTKYISRAQYYLSPDEESDKYLVHYGADKNKIFNYPYSTIYENEILSKKPDNLNELREQFNLVGKRIYISAGQFIKRKNYEVLIRSWNDMPLDHHLYLFGDGKLKNHYKKIIEELSLKNVHLQGFLPKRELLKTMSVSDVFVFPSHEDIYGHVINEALSQGLPVISNDNVNSAKKLLNGINGVMTNDFSAKNILRLSEKLLTPTSFEACIKTAKNNTIESMSSVIGKIFEEK